MSVDLRVDGVLEIRCHLAEGMIFAVHAIAVNGRRFAGLQSPQARVRAATLKVVSQYKHRAHQSRQERCARDHLVYRVHIAHVLVFCKTINKRIMILALMILRTLGRPWYRFCD